MFPSPNITPPSIYISELCLCELWGSPAVLCPVCISFHGSPWFVSPLQPCPTKCCHCTFLQTTDSSNVYVSYASYQHFYMRCQSDLVQITGTCIWAEFLISQSQRVGAETIMHQTEQVFFFPVAVQSLKDNTHVRRYVCLSGGLLKKRC